MINQKVATHHLQIILIISIFSVLLISGCSSGSLTAGGGGPTPTPTPGGPGPTPTPAPGVHTVTVTWSASTTTGLAGYNVYRGTVSGGPYSRITSTPTSAVQFTDSAVNANQTYFYVVTAVGGNGVESVVSNEIKVVIGP